MVLKPMAVEDIWICAFQVMIQFSSTLIEHTIPIVFIILNTLARFLQKKMICPLKFVLGYWILNDCCSVLRKVVRFNRLMSFLLIFLTNLCNKSGRRYTRNFFKVSGKSTMRRKAAQIC